MGGVANDVMNHMMEAWKDWTCRTHGRTVEHSDGTEHLKEMGTEGIMLLKLVREGGP
jgi:hypothetical protein